MRSFPERCNISIPLTAVIRNEDAHGPTGERGLIPNEVFSPLLGLAWHAPAVGCFGLLMLCHTVHENLQATRGRFPRHDWLNTKHELFEGSRSRPAIRGTPFHPFFP